MEAVILLSGQLFKVVFKYLAVYRYFFFWTFGKPIKQLTSESKVVSQIEYS